jgi:hypothetical protein
MRLARFGRHTPNGEQVITRHTLGQLLGKLDEVTGG